MSSSFYLVHFTVVFSISITFTSRSISLLFHFTNEYANALPLFCVNLLISSPRSLSLSLFSLLISYSNSIQKDCSCVDNCSEHCINVENTIVNMETSAVLTANENVNPSSTQGDDDDVVVNVNDNDNKCGTLADQVDATDKNNNSNNGGSSGNAERYDFSILLILFLLLFDLPFYLVPKKEHKMELY